MSHVSSVKALYGKNTAASGTKRAAASSLLALAVVGAACGQTGSSDPLPWPQPDAGPDGALPDAGPLPPRTSWLGEWMLSDDAAFTDGSAWPGRRRWVQTRVASIWVDPQMADGRLYTNSVYDEAGRMMGIYQYDPGKPLGPEPGSLRPVSQLYGQGSGGTVVAGDEKYFYADYTRLKKKADGTWEALGQVLVRYQRGQGPETNPNVYGWIPMSRFEGGDPVASEWKAGRNLSGKPGGLAAGGGLVFVSRPEENAILVYEREQMKLVTTQSAQAPRGLTFRHATSTLFAIENGPSGTRVVQEWNVQPSGTLAKGATVSNVGEAVAIAAGPERLYVADNALAAQRVRIFESRSNQYTEVDAIGQPGGVVAAKGQYADDRFDNLTGVAVDAEGNVYVAANGRGAYGWTDVRRFSKSKKLDAKLVNYVFQDAVVPDPRDPSTVYSAFHKYKLNYAATVPGQEWSPNDTQLTVDRATCPHDGRTPFPGTGATFQTQAVALRHLTGSDGVSRKYLFVRPIGSSYYNLGIYRFDDSVPRPSVLFSEGVNAWPNGAPSTKGVRQQWVDGNANCVIDNGEITDIKGNYNFISYAHSIDDHGDIWGAGNWCPKCLHYFRLGKFDAKNNPLYDEGKILDLADAPMDAIQQVHYIGATDTMYMYGASRAGVEAGASPRYILARYDAFRTDQRRLAWSIDMQYVSCYDPITYKYDFCIPQGLAVAGNRVYVADLAGPGGSPPGRVHIFDATTGANKGFFSAGPEVARAAGWVDIAVTGITAAELPNREHVIFREEDALGRILMYRYTPTE